MQKIQLSIPEPCHESWQNMTSTQQGRFCNACAKEVIDFSTMTDAQVFDYFSGLKNEKVCGRAYPDQLGRTITLPKITRKKLFGYWTYVTAFFLFFAKTSIKVQAQGQVVTAPVKRDLGMTLPIKMNAGITNHNSIVKGTITDENRAPVFANMRIKNSLKTVSTNDDGEYTISANVNLDTIEISAVGFEKKEVVLNGKKIVDVVLSKVLLEDLIVVGGMIAAERDGFSTTALNHIAVLEVKDNATLLPVKMASVIIKRAGGYKTDSLITDKKGICKLKKINEEDSYTLKITAVGYKEEEMKINGNDFDERKLIKQIFLEKLPSVVDYKKMDSVVVTSGTICKKGMMTTGAMTSVMHFERTYLDTLALVKTKITGALKIYPNPIKKGNAFTLTCKLKETGKYDIQIFDASGKIVLQKQIIAASKIYSEQLQTSNNWSSAIYYLRVFDSKNKMIGTNNFFIR
jgi:hypothetical protein